MKVIEMFKGVDPGCIDISIIFHPFIITSTHIPTTVIQMKLLLVLILIDCCKNIP